MYSFVVHPLAALRVFVVCSVIVAETIQKTAAIQAAVEPTPVLLVVKVVKVKDTIR